MVVNSDNDSEMNIQVSSNRYCCQLRQLTESIGYSAQSDSQIFHIP